MKKRLLINPPPRNLHCQRCGRKFEDLPVFVNSQGIKDVKPLVGPHAVVDKAKDVKLVKTYRSYADQISASWECQDCINMADIEDIYAYYKENNNVAEFDEWLIDMRPVFEKALKNNEKVFKYKGDILAINIVKNWYAALDKFGKEHFEECYNSY